MKTELKNTSMRFSALFKIRFEINVNEDNHGISNRYYNRVSVFRLYELGSCG
jgi:hypothetical protein